LMSSVAVSPDQGRQQGFQLSAEQVVAHRHDPSLGIEEHGRWNAEKTELSGHSVGALRKDAVQPRHWQPIAAELSDQIRVFVEGVAEDSKTLPRETRIGLLEAGDFGNAGAAPGGPEVDEQESGADGFRRQGDTWVVE